MDSHSSIASFYYGNSDSDDKVNKYEYSNDNFIIDQINTSDDSDIVKKWLYDFIETDEFIKICKISCAQNGYSIKHIPEKFITEELCEIACNKDGWAIEYIPKKFITRKLCEIAL